MSEAAAPFDRAPGLTPLLSLDVHLSPAVVIDETAVVGRRYIPIIGGSFWGELEGRVLPGGGDWQSVWPDRAEVSAHYILETAAGGRIEVQSNGLRHGPAEVIARLGRGEAVDPGEYYFRTALRFATGAPALAHLNRLLAVGVGARGPNDVQLQVFRVL